MNKTQPYIRRGIPEDAEILRTLAIKIFNETFAGNPLNKPEDMRDYIAEAFSLEQTQRELIEKDTIIFIVEVDGEMIGFAKMHEHSRENCISDLDPIELQRFYISHVFHGKGIAQILMQQCIAEAKRRNYQTLWLGVWEHNYRAQRFYEKLGFIKVGSHIFQLGSDAQTDLVMEKKLLI
jgi:ribosomal protein S18 acetylase RimI-like enzyme